MSLSFNQLTLAGNLTRDPMHKQLANDQAVCQFGVAVNRRYKKANGEVVDAATFVDCKAWGKLADFIAGHFGKGDPIFVQGRLETEEWIQDGAKRSRPVCIVDTATFVESKAKPAAPAAAPVEGGA